MRLMLALGVACFAASSADGQISCSVNGQPCPGTYATQADIAALQAQMPQPATTVPPPEVVGGAPGAAATYRRSDAVQPRITRSKAFTTASDGTAAVTWADMGAVPQVFAVPNVAASATQVPACYPVAGTVTSTGVTIKCYITQTLLGLGLTPFTAAAAGVTGSVFALPAAP